MLNAKIIQAIRREAVQRAAQVRVERMLERYEFNYLDHEGVWVRPGFDLKFMVAGASWIGFYAADSSEEPTYSGAGMKELLLVLEEVCG